MIANYHSIETFSGVDGPGIRYVLFLQGCNMNCKFCHNIDAVPLSTNKNITVEEVVEDYLKYQLFYKNGGITITGGEPLLQIDFIIELFTELKKHNVNTCIQTQGSLFRKTEKFDKLIELTDLFIVDLKGVDNDYSKRIAGARITRTLEFMNHLDAINHQFWMTYVLLPTFNDDDYCSKRLAEIISSFSPDNMRFNLLPYHKLGKDKWEKLNLKYQIDEIEPPTKEEVSFFNQKIRSEIDKINSKYDSNLLRDLNPLTE